MRRQFMLSIVFIFASMFLLVGYAEVVDAQSCTIDNQKNDVGKVNTTFEDEVRASVRPPQTGTVKVVMVLLENGRVIVMEGSQVNFKGRPSGSQGHSRRPGNSVPFLDNRQLGVIVYETGSPDCMVWNGVQYCW